MTMIIIMVMEVVVMEGRTRVRIKPKAGAKARATIGAMGCDVSIVRTVMTSGCYLCLYLVTAMNTSPLI